jgi:hypothetical protein
MIAPSARATYISRRSGSTLPLSLMASLPLEYQQQQTRHLKRPVKSINPFNRVVAPGSLAMFAAIRREIAQFRLDLNQGTLVQLYAYFFA